AATCVVLTPRLWLPAVRCASATTILAKRISSPNKIHRFEKPDWEVRFVFMGKTYRRGIGVGRGLAVGAILGVGEGLGVAVTVGVDVVVAVGVTVGVDVIVGVAVGVGLDVGVGDAVGVGVGLGVVPVCTSNDPLSIRPLRTRQKVGPR